MRQTPSPSCQKLFQKARQQQPGDSSAITFQNQCLSSWSLPFSFTFILLAFFFFFFLQPPAFSYVGFIPPAPIHVPFERVCLTGLPCWCCWRGSCLQPRLSRLHPHGEQAEGVVVVVPTKLVPPRHQTGGIPTAAGGSPRTN